MTTTDRVRLEPNHRRVRVFVDGVPVADTIRSLYLFETDHLPVYYFPRDDVRFDVLQPTDRSTHCPYKGDAQYWSIVVGDRRIENAVWAYPVPLPGTPDLSGYVAFYWNKVDNWFEEDEEVFVHARDPYARRCAALVTPRRDPHRRRDDRRHDQAGAAVRDRSSDAPLHPEGRRSARPAAPVVDDHRVPVQRHRRLLLRRRAGSTDGRRHCVGVSEADRAGPDDREPHQLLRRARRRSRRWRAAGSTDHALVLSGMLWCRGGSCATRSRQPCAACAWRPRPSRGRC